MPTVNIFDQRKNVVGEVELSADVFGVEPRAEILHLVVRSILAARRAGTHKVKTRSEVSGGGKKPWRQKGTGRARAGSSRSPIWRHGAVVHGPSPRDYGFKVNRKVRALAMKMALSSRAKDETLFVLDKIEMPEVKTRSMVEVCKALGLKKALIVIKDEDNNLRLSARNIPGLTVVDVEAMGVYDVLAHPQLVMTRQAAEDVQERLK